MFYKRTNRTRVYSSTARLYTLVSAVFSIHTLNAAALEHEPLKNSMIAFASKPPEQSNKQSIREVSGLEHVPLHPKECALWRKAQD